MAEPPGQEEKENGMGDSRKMLNLNKMGRAGMSYFDLNMEFFEDVKW